MSKRLCHKVAPNDLRYPQVGRRGLCLEAEKNLKPEKMPVKRACRPYGRQSHLSGARWVGSQFWMLTSLFSFNAVVYLAQSLNLNAKSTCHLVFLGSDR